MHCWADLQSVHRFRCYNNIHICKLIALYSANAYSGECEMSASACTRCMLVFLQFCVFLLVFRLCCFICQYHTISLDYLEDSILRWPFINIQWWISVKRLFCVLCAKTVVPGLHYSINCLMMCCASWTQYTSVTDRRTDTAPCSPLHNVSRRSRGSKKLEYRVTRMWANAQLDGRPAEHRWRFCSTPQSLADAHY